MRGEGALKNSGEKNDNKASRYPCKKYRRGLENQTPGLPREKG